MKYLIEAFVVLIVFIIGNVNIVAQKAFDCNGKMFRVLEEDGGTSFQEIKIQYHPFEVSFEDLQFFPDVQLNGICYRPKDNLIYGVELGEYYRLVRIDGNNELSILRDLPLPPQLSFVSGDISPDGRYLVLLGFSISEEGNLLAMVDLDDPEYPTTFLPLRSYNDQEAINCVDIAFHPTTGILYGFDHAQDKLVIVDIERQIIDDLKFAPTQVVKGNMPSLFFDPRGRLFGIASSRDNNSYRLVYEIDPQTGEIFERQNLELEYNQDACSCPFEVNLYNKVNNRQGFACSELEFTFSLVNRSPFDQNELLFRDTFHSGLIIKSIEGLPTGTRVLSGEGSNVLALDGLNLGIGTDTIKVRVDVPDQFSARVYKNRAYLSKVNNHFVPGGEMRLSDDPDTPKRADATAYELKSLEINFEDDFPILCEGDTINIGLSILGADFDWNTGAQSPFIEVMEEGLYEVTVSTGCESASAAVYVEEDKLRVDLGENIETEEGATINLRADIFSESTVQDFFWSYDEDGDPLSCLTCPSPELRISNSSFFEVAVINENGCMARDQLEVEVVAFKYFAPTAFSPDGNGTNDYFYLQGRYDFELQRFSIFDRWGSLLYDKKEGKANDKLFGWDGFSQGELLNAGIYIWRAEVRLATGAILQLSGEVNLIR